MKFGVGAEMDAFIFMFNLASIPVGVGIAVLTSVLIPAYTAIQTQGPETSHAFKMEAHTILLIGASVTACAFAAIMGLSPLLPNWSGLSPGSATAARQYVLPMALLIFFGMYGALLTTEAIAARNNVSTLLESTPSLVVCVALVVLAEASVNTLVWATVLGFILQTVVLAALRQPRIDLKRLFHSVSSPHWQGLKIGFTYMLIAQSLQSFTINIDQFWAARVGEGAISTMGYANRLTFLVLALGTTAISRSILPTLSQLAPADPHASNRTALLWAGSLLVLGGIATAILWPLGPLIVQGLFERGEFNSTNTRAVSEYFQYSLLQVPFALSCIVLIQWIFTSNLYHWMVFIAVLNLLVKVLANTILFNIFGLNGLALANGVMYLAAGLVLLAVMRNRTSPP